MDSYGQLKQRLLARNARLEELLENAAANRAFNGAAFDHWRSTCAAIRRQLSEEILRVAVVGAIKSGKSTFTNALLGQDHLKRGAGVVTSIVTRIRQGETLRATLFFKSWDDVNIDIEQALVLLPDFATGTDRPNFDLRRSRDRQALQKAFAGLGSEQLISDGMRNPNAVLLASYLQGYERLKETVTANTATAEYGDGTFAEHRRFVGDDNLAVYLKDIQLDVRADILDETLEIADCQGSDSPNPLHLTMIQDYLLKTHLIVYVISSRTGLREADIKFLTMIKQMGIFDNLLFVFNCDLSEHESLGDLQAVLEKTRGELALIRPGSDLYAISALLALFRKLSPELSAKDRLRLSQWELEKDLVDLSDRESLRFRTDFAIQLTAERLPLLLTNHLSRLEVTATGLAHWSGLRRQVLVQDEAGAGDIIARMRGHRGKIAQLQQQIRKALDGALLQVKRDLRRTVDGFFDTHSGPVMERLMGYIRGYRLPEHHYTATLDSAGFASTLYLVFQDFKKSLDAFMAQQVQPELTREIGLAEQQACASLVAVATPFDALVREAVADTLQSMRSVGIAADQLPAGDIEPPDLEGLKRLAGLSLPPAAVMLRYSVRIKGEAVLRLGAYRLWRLGRQLLRKLTAGDTDERVLALDDALARIKRETEQSVRFHLKDHRENIKHQYAFKVADMAAEQVAASMNDRFQAYISDLSDWVQQAGRQEADHGQTLAELDAIGRQVREITHAIGRLKEDLLTRTSARKETP